MRYRTILADPAWTYNDLLPLNDVQPLRGAADHYKTMSLEEICALGSNGQFKLGGPNYGYEADEDSFLWLWTTNPHLLDGSAMKVCIAWGFKPKQLVTWVKGRLTLSKSYQPSLVLRTGMGHYTRGCTEHMILATRGRPKVYVKDQGVNNVVLQDEDTLIFAQRGVHSKKPEEAYHLIERVCPGPYLELFARQSRENWTSWGDQL